MGKVREEDMQLSSGLQDDFDAVIASVEFGISKEYALKSGTSDPMLTLTFGSEEAESFSQSYSIGGARQWQIGKGGKEVISQIQPDAHSWNMNSRAGTLVKRMFQLVGNGDMKKGQQFFLSRDRYMTEADFYIGLKFHWKREKMQTLGGEERDVLLPVAWIGEVKTVVKGTVPDTSMKKVIELAIGKTERELKGAILEDPELSKNLDLLDKIFKENLLQTLETGGKLVKVDGKFQLRVV